MSELKTIKYSEYEEGIKALIDENSCPCSVLSDYVKRNRNLLSKKKLCKKCDGTGNQFRFMYQKCSKCDGKGISKGSSKQQGKESKCLG